MGGNEKQLLIILIRTVLTWLLNMDEQKREETIGDWLENLLS